jgi:integrase
MIPLVELALETAMRCGELLIFLWNHIDLNAQIALLLMTKNKMTRDVPLSRRTVAILAAPPRLNGDIVFPLYYMTMYNCFTDACKRAGITNLHYHDLRYTATSRLTARPPNVIELTSVTGHQKIQMLKRYHHPKAAVKAQELG